MPLSLTFPPGGMLVAGGTGNVGVGVVRQLARADVPLVFTYRANAQKAAELCTELNRQGKRVWAQEMDMRQTGSIKDALERVVAECGSIHGIACASGPPGGLRRLMDFSVEHVAAHMLDDAVGYYRLVHTALPMLRANRGGTITLISTFATDRVLKFDGISPMSKGAVNAMMRQIAVEEAQWGIRCNAVSIGWVEERSWEQILEQTPEVVPEKPQSRADHVTAIVRWIMDRVPMARAGRPEEAGNLYAFLASNEASYITGQNIAVDGGVSL